MNPRAELLRSDELPPLAEVRKNMRIRWYRCPIERDQLRELAEPSDMRGMFQALGHLALWLVTGLTSYYLYTQQIWVGFFVPIPRSVTLDDQYFPIKSQFTIPDVKIGRFGLG